MGSKMDYYVAADAGGEVQALMQARGVRGIPHAFILDVNGNVVWEGHPMTPDFEKHLQAVSA
eukprot:GABW01000186.1.p1 GENE.GABW01000186.1~~GABW01000186.1.p1  ORF type:complete len:62 (+),score=12.07 GABW01000186.1:99-284(+)